MKRLRESQQRILAWVLALVATAMFVPGMTSVGRGEDGGGSAAAKTESGDAGGGDPVDDGSTEDPADDRLNILALLVKGGWFMVPIGIMFFLTITFGIERLIGLRRSRVIPIELVRDLGKLGGNKTAFDPRSAYRLCQQFPSSASRVIRAMLLKVGRPHSEVEHTVQEASQREAERLYANCRILNLAATITPLIGLAGTVWGMIDAFHGTTQLDPHASKAEHLAEGIYLALVTTLSGLFVAIPAAITSHYYEGRIQTMFHEIDELLFNLMPNIERFEGRVRFSRQMDGTEGIVDQGDGVQPATSTTPT